MSAPSATVVIACHNYGRFLGDALGSVQRSIATDWECWVVDDGSTDDSSEVAQRFARLDNRIRLWRTPSNQGVVAAYNSISNRVRGEFAVFLDADDTVTPDRIGAVCAALRSSPHAALVLHRLCVADERLHPLGVMPLVTELPAGKLRGSLLATETPPRGMGITSNLAMPTHVFQEIFPADVRCRNNQDELMRRVAPLYGEVIAIDAVLGLRRLHGTNFVAARNGITQFLMQGQADYAAIHNEFVRHARALGVASEVLESAEATRGLTHGDLILDRLTTGDNPARDCAPSERLGSASGRVRRRRAFLRLLPRRLVAGYAAARLRPGGVKLIANYLMTRRRCCRSLISDAGLPLPRLQDVARAIVRS